MRWQVQEAKQRFSEVVRHAEADGPQGVTRHGRDVVVVVAVAEFERLSGTGHDFKQFLSSAPDLDRLRIDPPRQPARRVELDA